MPALQPPGGNQVDGLPPAQRNGAVVVRRPGAPAKMYDFGNFDCSEDYFFVKFSSFVTIRFLLLY